jgi:hypothetical protein
VIHLSRRTVAIALAAFLALAAIATTSLVLTLTGRADASHRFGDIGDTNFFHDSTAWLKDNGIADGFNDGTFRPNSNITRGQASYWFGNYNSSIEVVEANTNPGSAIAWQTGAQCPAGKRPVAGGGSINTNGLPIGVILTESYPSDSFDFPNQWRVMWESKDGTQVDPPTLTVYAVCIPDTIS